jgi:HK97 family phage portal protein
MLESRQYSTEEIARAFRCPPALLGVTTPGAMSYASVEMNGIHFVTYCLRPYIVKIEDAYSNLIPGDAFLKINVDGLLRSDLSTRYAAHSVGISSGFLTVDEARAYEDLPPLVTPDPVLAPDQVIA